MSFLRKIIEGITGANHVRLLTEKGRERLEREQRKEDAIVHRAWESSAIQQLAAEIGLTEDHLRDVYRRFRMLGQMRLARRSINDAELLRWYYEHGGKEKRLDADAMIELFSFAKTRRLE